MTSSFVPLFLLLSGGLTLGPLWFWAEPEAASGGSAVWKDTLRPQWCIMGRPGHSKAEWQWELEGNTGLAGAVLEKVVQGLVYENDRAADKCQLNYYFILVLSIV